MTDLLTANSITGEERKIMTCATYYYVKYPKAFESLDSI
jgi:hypothetical protein